MSKSRRSISNTAYLLLIIPLILSTAATFFVAVSVAKNEAATKDIQNTKLIHNSMFSLVSESLELGDYFAVQRVMQALRGPARNDLILLKEGEFITGSHDQTRMLSLMDSVPKGSIISCEVIEKSFLHKADRTICSEYVQKAEQAAIAENSRSKIYIVSIISQPSLVSVPTVLKFVGLGLTLSVLFAYLVRFLLHRWILGPLRAISATLLDSENEKRGRIVESSLLLRAPQELWEIAAAISDYHERIADTVLKEAEAGYQNELLVLAKQVSHDIRSPITALRAIADNSPELDPGKHKLLISVTKRIDAIAATILERTRPKANQKQEKSTIELVNSLKNVVDEKNVIQSKLGENGNICILSSHALADRKLDLDLDMISRVFSNILNNAIEASPAGESIRIEIEDDARLLRCRVIDYGRGIPSEVLARIGKEEVTYGKVDGNGLGLIQAIRYLDSIGGRLKIVAGLSRGTVIEIEIPFVPILNDVKQSKISRA